MIVIVLAMCCCKQQTPECPYTFMGIPLDITREEFEQKLVEKGFVKNDRGKMLTGLFFNYRCTISLEPRPLFDNKNEIIKQAVVMIYDSVFDNVRAGLMEKYSDTTKWRIDDMSGDDFNVPILLIYSTDNDARPYIQLAGLYDQTSISYSK